MIKENIPLKKAFVTGSTRGIGRAIALRLAADGYHILVHGAGNRAKAEETKSLIEQAGGSAEILMANLCDLNETKALGKKVADVDALILNASLQYRTPWQEITAEACYEQLNCNFVSSMLLIQAVAEGMKQKQWGRIVTVGSVQEAKPHPDMMVYAASKAAQTNMVQNLALQLAPFNITVNNVAPGIINTDRNAEALSDPAYAQKVAESIPLGFYGNPEDCAGMISLLCGEDGRYITGQNIFIDGGKSIQ